MTAPVRVRRVAAMLLRHRMGKCSLWMWVLHCSDEPVAARRSIDGFQPTPWECPECGTTCQADDLKYEMFEGPTT